MSFQLLSPPSLPAPADGTIVVTGDYVLAHGERLELSNPGFILAANGGTASLQIAGKATLTVADDGASITGVMSKVGDSGAESVTIAEGGKLKLVAKGDDTSATGIYLQSAQSLAIDGQLSVNAERATGISAQTPGAHYELAGVVNAHATLSAGGMTIGGIGSVVENSGVIKAKAIQAIGVYAFAQGVDFTNDGLILAKGFTTGAHGTAGFYGEAGVSFTNNGVILVRADDGAVGVQISDTAGFLNAGRITVQTQGDPQFISAGMFINATVDASYVNTGRIQGPHAILSVVGSGTVDSQFINEGKLLGVVELSLGVDVFTNSGKMHGDVFLAEGDDSFDSSHGKLNGVVEGGLGDDTIVGSGGRDTLYGDNADDPSSGGADLLRGGKGVDVIDGGAGADTIGGGESRDQLTGGAGADVFTFRAVSDSTAGGIDTITDLDNADTIYLAAMDADTTQAGDQAFHLVGAFTAAAGELMVSYDAGAGRTLIQGDVDGDGSADLVIFATGDHHGFTHFEL